MHTHKQCKERWRQLCLQSSTAARGDDSACLHGCRNPSPTPSRCKVAENKMHHTTDYMSQTHISHAVLAEVRKGWRQLCLVHQHRRRMLKKRKACTVAAICLCPPMLQSPLQLAITGHGNTHNSGLCGQQNALIHKY